MHREPDCIRPCTHCDYLYFSLGEIRGYWRTLRIVPSSDLYFVSVDRSLKKSKGRSQETTEEAVGNNSGDLKLFRRR